MVFPVRLSGLEAGEHQYFCRRLAGVWILGSSLRTQRHIPVKHLNPESQTLSPTPKLMDPKRKATLLMEDILQNLAPLNS